MKDDHMGNDQLKPAYNFLMSTDVQSITHYRLFPNQTDTVTLIPFLKVFQERYDSMPRSVVADT